MNSGLKSTRTFCPTEEGLTVSCRNAQFPFSLLRDALVFLSRNRIILYKLLSKLESEWEGFDQDCEGDGALLLLLGDGDLRADGHHRLPCNKRDTSSREELLKVLVPVQLIRPKQPFHHGPNRQYD